MKGRAACPQAAVGAAGTPRPTRVWGKPLPFRLRFALLSSAISGGVLLTSGARATKGIGALITGVSAGSRHCTTVNVGGARTVTSAVEALASQRSVASVAACGPEHGHAGPLADPRIVADEA